MSTVSTPVPVSITVDPRLLTKALRAAIRLTHQIGPTDPRSYMRVRITRDALVIISGGSYYLGVLRMLPTRGATVEPVGHFDRSDHADVSIMLTSDQAKQWVAGMPLIRTRGYAEVIITADPRTAPDIVVRERGATIDAFTAREPDDVHGFWDRVDAFLANTLEQASVPRPEGREWGGVTARYLAALLTAAEWDGAKSANTHVLAPSVHTGGGGALKGIVVRDDVFLGIVTGRNIDPGTDLITEPVVWRDALNRQIEKGNQ